MTILRASGRRKRARKYISLREKLAAALSMLLPQEQRDELRAKKVPAKVVIGLFDFDHAILHALGGPDIWPNMTPLLRVPHREKSRRDTSTVAKVDRITAAEIAHATALAAKGVKPMMAPGVEAEFVREDNGTFRRVSPAKDPELYRRPKARIPSRPFPKGQRTLRSRNSFQRRQP